MNRRGFTLIECLTGIVVFGIVMAAIFTAFVGMWNNTTNTANGTLAQVSAEQVVWVFANAFQTSTICGSSDSGCVANAAASNASTSGCTVYSRSSSGALVQNVYGMSGGNFQVTTNGTTALVAVGMTVSVVYYQSSSYNATSLSAFTPTNSTISNLIAVQITATGTQGTNTTSYTTLVRIPNGP